MSNQSGVIVVLSGPSGVGKDTLIRLIVEQSGYRKFAAYTTRPARPGEVNGEDYLFVDVTTFKSLLAREEFLDHILVDGNHYGTPLNDFRNVQEKGGLVILHLAADTALLLREKVPGVRTIFVLPPSREALTTRLRGRGMTEAAIATRVANDPTRLEALDEFDLTVINHDGEQEETARRILTFLGE